MSPADPFGLENQALKLNLEKQSLEICIFNHRAKHKCGPMNAYCFKLNVSMIFCIISPEKKSWAPLFFSLFLKECFSKKLFPHMAVFSLLAFAVGSPLTLVAADATAGAQGWDREDLWSLH